MDGEEKKSGSKKRSKPVESDDDEPIGSLLRLKRPRNPKKVKSGSESGGEGGKKVEVREERLEVESEDLGGMDDTLASFKKKLKGPKKDSGYGIIRGSSSSLNVADSPDRSLSGPVEDRECDEKSISKVVEKVRVTGDDGSDMTMDVGVEYKCKGKVKSRKINSTARTIDGHVTSDNDLESLGSGCNSLREQESGMWSVEGPDRSVDEHLEDSLSAFVRKAQSGLIRKSWASSSLKQKRDAQTLEDDGFSPCSESVSGTSKPVTSRRLRSGSASKLDCNSLKSKNKRPDGSFCEVSDCIEENDDSTRRLTSDSSNKEEIMRPRESGHDRSSKFILEDPSPVSPSSRSTSKGIQDEATEEPCGLNAQEGSKVDNDSSDQVCDGDFTCVQIKENISAPSQKAAMGTRTFKNRLKHCSTVDTSTLVHDVEKMPNSISGPKKMEEMYAFGKGEPNRGFRESLMQHSVGVPTMHVSNADLQISSSLVGKGILVTNYDDALLNKSCKFTPNEIFNSVSEKVLEVSSKCVSHNSSPRMKMGETCSGGAGLNTCTEEPDLASDFLQKKPVMVSDVRLSPRTITSTGAHKSGLGVQVNHQEKISDTCLDPNKSFPSMQKCSSTLHQNQPSDDALKGICALGHDYLSVNEEAYGDENEDNPEDAMSVPDCENKDKKLSAVQRVVRKPKKHRHGDMAYEGDADWDILLHEQGFLESQGVVDSDLSFRTRAKCDTSSNIGAEAENGGAAAVSAGLKAHAAGPVEKIKFKEVLKRKGGLQEFLECR